MKADHPIDVLSIPPAEIETVLFYKRDLLTLDLICCDVGANGLVWTLHEDAEEWSLLLGRLKLLPGFRTDWFEHVSRPAFATSEFTAFQRNR